MIKFAAVEFNLHSRSLIQITYAAQRIELAMSEIPRLSFSFHGKTCAMTPPHSHATKLIWDTVA